MKRNVEQNIRLNALVIYLLVACFSGALLLFLYKGREANELHKQNVQKYRQNLELIDSLSLAVQRTQDVVNLFVISKDSNKIALFEKEFSGVKRLVDSITNTKSYSSSQLLMFAQMDSLLDNQRVAVFRLNHLFSVKNPVQTLSEQLLTYQPEEMADSVVVTSVVYDTVLTIQPQKSFLKRLSQAFSPKQDTVILPSSQKIYTHHVAYPAETKRIVNTITQATQEASSDYDEHIRKVQAETYALMDINIELTKNISQIIKEIYRQSLDSFMDAVTQSEQITARNYKNSIIGGSVTLILIFVLILFILRDVKQGWQMRRDLEDANELNRQIMESRHKLLLSVSHDIKTPLSSILGYLDLLPQSDEVYSMRNSASLIRSMLQNLLEFSSLQQGKLQLSIDTYKPQLMVKEIQTLFHPIAVAKNLALQVNLHAENKDILLSGDQLKIKQIIINLLSNAIKYTVKGTVSLSLSVEKELLIISVVDSGVGVPPEKQSLLFHPFSRVESNNRYAEGTGLGLYVVKGLVDLMQGDIHFISDVGKGTSVVVELPTSEVTVKVDQKKKQIVVVDDDPTILKMAVSMLESLGHSVVGYASPQPTYAADMILTDMEMGDASGLDVLQRAKGIPVVLMTGKEDMTSSQARSLGFAQFIRKPFSREVIEQIFGLAHPPLEEQFEMDDDIMSQVIVIFKEASKEDIQTLREALVNQNFRLAQATSHRMVSMFAQLNLNETVGLLRKVDANRDQEYLGWQQDVEQIIDLATRDIQTL